VNQFVPVRAVILRPQAEESFVKLRTGLFSREILREVYPELTIAQALSMKAETKRSVIPPKKGQQGGSCHCEEPQATKQSLQQAKIASLRSQ
jgi:hypothetical protein